MSADRRRVDARYRHGNDLRMRGDTAAAEAELRAVLVLEPSHRDAAYSLAFMLREEGRVGAASKVVFDGASQSLETADEALAAIGFLVECSAYAYAIELSVKARETWPADARIATRAGEMLLAAGRFDEARQHLLVAIELDRNQSAAWLKLSYCQRYRETHDADIARFATAAGEGKLSPITQICAGFAWGKALDDVGLFANAAAAFREANAHARTLLPWDSLRWRALVKKRSTENLPTTGAASAFEPIFVIGMPRTGTTLVSTLLARNEDIRDRGELNWVPSLYAHLSDANRLHDRDALAVCSQLIESQMRRDDAPVRCYVDKNPLNFAYIDFILAMFPRARFIYCRRDARDTALSIWMQHFAQGDLGFAYDFSTIALVDADHHRLMERWKPRFAARILDVNYEELVAEPDLHADRLAQFVTGRPSTSRWSPSEQILTTASVWQARQPVYSSSIGRWRNYAAYVPELERLFPGHPPSPAPLLDSA